MRKIHKDYQIWNLGSIKLQLKSRSSALTLALILTSRLIRSDLMKKGPKKKRSAINK